MNPRQDLLRQLEADRDAITAGLNGGTPVGRVVRVETGLSDPHDGGRSVAMVEFAAGFRVVYKPRPVGLEAAFYDLVMWWNRHADGLTLRAARTIDRGDHGWMECIAAEPCADGDAAGRYYERAGALICLATLLDATDLHCGNVIAHGEYPVPVDLETLLHPRWPGEERSLLDTGLVPAWIRGPDGTLYDVSGFGAIAIQQFAGEPVPLRQNVLRVRGEIASPAPFAERIVAGFRQAGEVLRSARAELLAAGGPLQAFRGRQVRVILRHTLTYREALRAPDCLAADSLLRPVQDPALLDAITAAERRALRAGDIPRFTATTDSSDWSVDGELTVPRCFATASQAALTTRLRRLDPSAADAEARLLSTALAMWSLRDLVAAGAPAG